MKKIILSITTLLIASSILTFCKKKTECTAGSGGNLTIVAFPQHHGKTIYNKGNYPDTVYIKFNTQDFPGPNPASYDIKFVGDSGEDHVHCHGLQCGNYYLYAVGLDTSINQRVTGGIPFSTSQQSGEIDLNIPVTE
jgi:hypothetical protein